MRILSGLLSLALLFFGISCKEKTRQPDHIAWAISTEQRAEKLSEGKHPALAIQYLDSACQSLSKPGIRDLWVKYNLKAKYYTYSHKDLIKRSLYIDSMLFILKDVKETYQYEYAHSLYEKAIVLQEQKRYTEAFRFYYDGRSYAKGNHDYCSLSDFTSALGVIRYTQEKYPQAVQYFKQAYTQISSCSDQGFQYSFVQRQGILNSIALCFEKSGRPDSAVYYYKRALQFIQKKQNSDPERQDFITCAQGVVEGNLGGSYARLGRFKEAQQHLTTSIGLNDRPGFYIEDAQTARIKLAKLYMAYKLLPKAKSLLDKLEEDLATGRGRRNSYCNVRKNWYQAKALYYSKTGDFPKAYQFLTTYHAYRDSLGRLQSGLTNIDTEQILRDYEQKYKLSLLKKDNDLKGIYMVGLSIFLAMSSCIAFIVWRHYRRSRTNVRQLTQLNEQMQIALSALENSQQENTMLMKIVAHDLRNPIGAISSMAEIMLDDTGRSQNDKEYLKLIKDSGSNSLEMVNNLLHMNGLSDIIFGKENLDLADIVRYCAGMLRAKANEKQQRINLDLQPAVLLLNYEKMWRVVSNLLSNAIKFSPVGSDIDVSLDVFTQYAELNVKDQGIGIPAELGEKIFHTFTDARRKGTLGEESFGLGLSITKKIVEAHSGKISFESSPNKGTNFKIVLPRFKDKADPFHAGSSVSVQVASNKLRSSPI